MDPEDYEGFPDLEDYLGKDPLKLPFIVSDQMAKDMKVAPGIYTLTEGRLFHESNNKIG